MARKWGGGEDKGIRQGLCREVGKFLGVVNMFTFLIVVLVSWVYACIKAYQIVYFKHYITVSITSQ